MEIAPTVPGFFGVINESSEITSNILSKSRLTSDGAIIHTTSRRNIAIATWSLDNNRHLYADDNCIVVLLGNPRLADRAPTTVSPNHSLARFVLDSFRSYGDDVLDLLNGRFALAICDTASSRVLLAIDKLGIESIYYSTSLSGTICFSSDLEFIRKYSGVSYGLDVQSIFDYTYFHTVPSPRTIYAGISKLPLAHKVSIQKNHLALSRYWLPEFNNSGKHTYEDPESRLIESLRSSVARYSSYENVGAFLSGGLDSSTICGLLTETKGERIPAVSVGFDVEEYDEIRFAKSAAKQFDLEHHIHYMSPREVMDSIPIVINNFSEPFGNSSAIPTYICALHAKNNGIQTLLAGDGGDELFAGNSRYVKQQVFELYAKFPGSFREKLLEPIVDLAHSKIDLKYLNKLSRYIEQANVPLPERLHTYNILEVRPLESIFQGQFLGDVSASHPADLLRSEFTATDACTLNRMLHLDWRFTLADNDIRKVIGSCRQAGVEVEFPFLDEDVLDFSLTVPPSSKIRHGRLRYFYKRAVSHYLPDSIIKKQKHGFGLPFGEWLRSSDQLQDMVYDTLFSLSKRDIFRRSFIDALIADHREKHASYFGNMVWVLAVLEWWISSRED